MPKNLKSDWAKHLHHDILVEYCYNYTERVDFIKKYKPEAEQPTRLRLFQILPKKALQDIPLSYQKADKARREAYKAWGEAGKAWPQKDKETFHKKWCGCKEWNGKELVFA